MTDEEKKLAEELAELAKQVPEDDVRYACGYLAGCRDTAKRKE